MAQKSNATLSPDAQRESERASKNKRKRNQHVRTGEIPVKSLKEVPTTSTTTTKLSTMVPATFFFLILLSLGHLSSTSSSARLEQVNSGTFEIADDMFWKDGNPFQIIGGDLHYFRVLPEYWEDRLLRAKALGLNTIQTYVPWNLHEPTPGKLVFEGIADLVSFLKLCQKLDLLVMLRAGPYVCAEWDLGGFPAWLLAIKPALALRTSDPSFLQLVDTWWRILLPKVAALLYKNGGPIIMVQIENEYGSYGDDRAYLQYLVTLARELLGNDTILYTTDGATEDRLENGTIRGDTVFSTIDFQPTDNPENHFLLQSKFNAPGKSPPLCSEFYTGWLTHWGEDFQRRDFNPIASGLRKILSLNGSAVLYMAHGGTNFGFYNGANTANAYESSYTSVITSYDYDAPIQEAGDVDNEKFRELRSVIQDYTSAQLDPIPPNNAKTGYGAIQLEKIAYLFDLFASVDVIDIVESENPLPMESISQMFGFLLYASGYAAKETGSILFIPEVHDRAQVFTSCPSKDNDGRPSYVGSIERSSNGSLPIPYVTCASNISLFILVENMGHINFGEYLFDRKGILPYVCLDGSMLHGWKMSLIPLPNLNGVQKFNPVFETAFSMYNKLSAPKKLKANPEAKSKEPTFYAGSFTIDKMDQINDTYISFRGWGKGVAFVNGFNIGRFWPLLGPQCNLYVPAPFLRHGENVVVVLELESPHAELLVHSVDQPDFTCHPSSSKGFDIQQEVFQLETPNATLLVHSVDRTDITHDPTHSKDFLGVLDMVV